MDGGLLGSLLAGWKVSGDMPCPPAMLSLGWKSSFRMCRTGEERPLEGRGGLSLGEILLLKKLGEGAGVLVYLGE